jgi:hypothetical protein
MATHQSRGSTETISRVVHEFKHGELESSSGQKVKNPGQAIAIGLREAGASNYESKEKKRGNLKRTKARERRGATEKDRRERHDQGQISRRALRRGETPENSGAFEDEQGRTRARFAQTQRWPRGPISRDFLQLGTVATGAFSFVNLFIG